MMTVDRNTVLRWERLGIFPPAVVHNGRDREVHAGPGPAYLKYGYQKPKPAAE